MNTTYKALSATAERTEEKIVLRILARPAKAINKKATAEDIIKGTGLKSRITMSGFVEFPSTTVNLSGKTPKSKGKKGSAGTASIDGDAVSIPGIEKIDSKDMIAVKAAIAEVMAMRDLSTNAAKIRHMYVRDVPRRYIARALSITESTVTGAVKNGLKMKNFGI